MKVSDLLDYARRLEQQYGGSCEVSAMILDPGHVQRWTTDDDGEATTTVEEAMQVCERLAAEVTRPEAEWLEWMSSVRVHEVLAEVRKEVQHD